MTSPTAWATPARRASPSCFGNGPANRPASCDGVRPLGVTKTRTRSQVVLPLRQLYALRRGNIGGNSRMLRRQAAFETQRVEQISQSFVQPPLVKFGLDAPASRC